MGVLLGCGLSVGDEKKCEKLAAVVKVFEKRPRCKPWPHKKSSIT